MENQDTFSKLSEYIETNEKNKEIIVQTLRDIFSESSHKEEIDKLKAAYALNLCTVSISQIVDYNDINILEQEYDAILNNLNLEQMPKDEALLRILKQILDTITYFRIEEVEKEFIEKDYQQKMKNAIWSAVPNFGVIIASGNPITAAVSLASQVGIGYMNYRREKAERENEKEKQMWQLRKTAIEQFNGLRRELFDTAWRLADEYDFPDEYRLTEKQIAQYNNILMDNDEIRKYERLYSIKDKFQAYPPFWYFIGNTAKRISEDESLKENVRADFALKAPEYFEKFFELNKYNILREDQLAASGSLEYAEILLNDKNPDNAKITECIDSARKLCGNAFDVLQLCAYLYLRNNEADKASEILRILVNEDYNRIINAQLLSGIYVREGNETDYDLLSTRVDEKYLYPMHGNNNTFENNQRAVLAHKFAVSLSDFFNKYAIEWNKIIPVFEADNYPYSFFAYTPNAKEYRLCEAEKIFKDKKKNEDCRERIAGCNYTARLLDIVNETYNKLFSFVLFDNPTLKNDSKKYILNKLENNKEKYNTLANNINSGKFSEEDFKLSQSDELSIINIFKETILLLSNHLSKKIKFADIETLSKMEGTLSEFCSSNGLIYPEMDNKKLTVTPDENPNHFLPEIFGESVSKAKINTDLTKEIIECIKKHINDANEAEDVLFTNDKPKFKEYFNNKAFIKKAGATFDSIINNSIAIYKDKKFDLHFTINGVLSVYKNSPQELVSYRKVKIGNDKITLTKSSYTVPHSIADVFEIIIRDIDRIRNKYKPADEKAEERTAIDELFSALNLNISNTSDNFNGSTLVDLEKYFAQVDNHELEEMLKSGQLNRRELAAVKFVLKGRGYAGGFLECFKK